jgi:hypothetical protein
MDAGYKASQKMLLLALSDIAKKQGGHFGELVWTCTTEKFMLDCWRLPDGRCILVQLFPDGLGFMFWQPVPDNKL